MRLKAYYFWKAQPSFNHKRSDGTFRSIHFFKIKTKDDPFVPSITNDDVLANNIRIASIYYAQYSIFQEAVYRPPAAICLFRLATVNVINFPSSGQTGWAGFNELLKCCREFNPNSGQTGFASYSELLKCCKVFSFQYNGLTAAKLTN